MNKKIACAIKKANCQASHVIDNVYTNLWVKKGYARSAIQRDFEYIYLGKYNIKTINIGLINSELGGNSVEQPSIILSADDWQVDVPREYLHSWYTDNVIYYCSRPDYVGVNDTGFLDEHGEFNGKRFRILEVRAEKMIYFRLILREQQERRLTGSGNIYGQITD